MILGIDYGAAHIGLAVSETGSFATPKQTLTVKNQEQAVKKVVDIAHQWNITQIVVGVSEGKSKQAAENFGKRLASVLTLKVDFVDETLSSHEAKPTRFEEKNKEHARAAAVILQRYLDIRSE